MRRAYEPLQVEQRDLSGGLDPISPRTGPGGRPYAAARVLVRSRSRPLGFVHVSLPARPEDLERAVELDLGEVAAAHRPEPPAPGGDPPFVSVVVPTRDRPGLLERSVASVLASDYPDDRFEVVVVDNAPSDARTRELVERAWAGRVRYLVEPRTGSGSARNAGAEAAAGELVAFVDDDAVADRRWLPELVAGFRAGSEVSFVTGLVVAAELDTWAQQLFEEYGGFGKGFEPTLLDLGANRPDHPMFPFNPALAGSGNNVAFRRSALLEAGGYDPALGNGTPTRSAEDWELFLRLFRAGHTAAYRPGAIVHHRHRPGLDDLRRQIHDYGVGIGAALTRTVVNEPAATLEIARRLPYAGWFLLSSRSSKNRNRSDGYPAALRRAELAGLARGPFAYLSSRRAA